MTNEPSAPERVQAAYRKLSASATNLNTASDELRIIISVLEDALKKLNLGISTWVKIAGNEESNGDFWSRNLGYARVGGKWGIALRELSGNQAYDDYEKDESWLFNDAPRWLRIEGVGKIPELLEKLTTQADDTTEKIRKKTAEAKELATAITTAVAESKPTYKFAPTPPSIQVTTTREANSTVTTGSIGSTMGSLSTVTATKPRK
jgi:hypothetical protein